MRLKLVLFTGLRHCSHSLSSASLVDRKRHPTMSSIGAVERAALDHEVAPASEQDRQLVSTEWDRAAQVAGFTGYHCPRDLGPPISLSAVRTEHAESMRRRHWGNGKPKSMNLNVWQAERIFALAKRAAAAGAAGRAAFQLLNEVLYFNKDHAEVRKILGHRKTDDGWRVAPGKNQGPPGQQGPRPAQVARQKLLAGKNAPF